MKKIKFTRTCPNCNSIIEYQYKKTMLEAEKRNSFCKKCAMKKTHANPEWRNKISKSLGGRKFSKQHRQNIKKARKNQIITKEHKNNISKGIIKAFENPEIRAKLSINNRGLSKQKINKWKKKLSKANSGSNNAMFGKPSPKGSGNGWSGWYNGFYFRSILELSYIKYLIDNGIKFESGEQDKYAIKYFDSYKNIERNYFPDFYLIDTEEIIEIKPKKLINAKQNKDKFTAAKEKHGNKFKIITEEIRINVDELKLLYENGKIKFQQRYENKYKDWLNEHCNN